MVAVRFLLLPVLGTAFVSAQIESVFSSITSGAASVFSQATSGVVSVATGGATEAASIGQVITSAAGNVEEKVTSAAGSIVTVVTSDGGKAFTLGENGVGTAVTDLTQFYASATSAGGTAATGNKNAGVGHLHNQRSMALFASFGAIVGGFVVGARMVL